jgi:hypothetical protein
LALAAPALAELVAREPVALARVESAVLEPAASALVEPAVWPLEARVVALEVLPACAETQY